MLMVPVFAYAASPRITIHLLTLPQPLKYFLKASGVFHCGSHWREAAMALSYPIPWASNKAHEVTKNMSMRGMPPRAPCKHTKFMWDIIQVCGFARYEQWAMELLKIS